MLLSFSAFLDGGVPSCTFSAPFALHIFLFSLLFFPFKKILFFFYFPLFKKKFFEYTVCGLPRNFPGRRRLAWMIAKEVAFSASLGVFGGHGMIPPIYTIDERRFFLRDGLGSCNADQRKRHDYFRHWMEKQKEKRDSHIRAQGRE